MTYFIVIFTSVSFGLWHGSFSAGFFAYGVIYLLFESIDRLKDNP